MTANSPTLFTALRHHRTLATAGRLLARNSERYLKSPRQMQRLFADLPKAIANTLELVFTSGIHAQRPRIRISPLSCSRRRNHDVVPARAHSRRIPGTLWAREPDLNSRARRQIERELELIENSVSKDISSSYGTSSDFAASKTFSSRADRSAANSAVCYSLGITAVDPIRMELTVRAVSFRNAASGPTSISISQRRANANALSNISISVTDNSGAAMTANVITYRNRMAAREMGKVMGFDARTAAISAAVATWEFRDEHDALDQRRTQCWTRSQTSTH